jgi:hypothetical protein
LIFFVLSETTKDCDSSPHFFYLCLFGAAKKSQDDQKDKTPPENILGQQQMCRNTSKEHDKQRAAIDATAAVGPTRTPILFFLPFD